MKPEALILERKIIGVLIRAAREKARRTVKQVARRLGVTAARARQYELGTREISLPELESLALFLRVPLSFFLSGEPVTDDPLPKPPTSEEIRARRAMLGAKLKQARMTAGKSLAECAQLIGRTPGTVSRYERGLIDIPITELERLSKLLKVNLSHFVQDNGQRGGAELMDLEAWARLPNDVRLFIMDTNSLPYLRMAIKFRDLPKAKLKELGEILLVVR